MNYVLLEGSSTRFVSFNGIVWCEVNMISNLPALHYIDPSGIETPPKMTSQLVS